MTTLKVPGRLFGPGLAAAGVAVDATIDVFSLSLSAPDGERLTARLDAIELRRAGFDEAHWQFGWQDGERRWALLVSDTPTLARLEQQPPAALRPAVEALVGKRRRDTRNRRLGLSAVAFYLALPALGLIALLLAARPLSGWLAGFVSVQKEAQLGDWFFDQQKAQLKLVEDTEANRAVEAIGQRLTTGSAYRYRWYVTRDPSLNAFAVPGGIVVVHTGLIEAADSADELAGVLAHEVEHVEQRHSLKAMVQQAGLRLAVAVLIGDLGMAGQAAGQLSGLSFSRDSEREADTRGLQRLVSAGIDPDGMLRIFAKLDAGHGGQAPPAWLSSHPAVPERIRELERQLADGPAGRYRPLDIDWNAVQASLGS